MNNTVRNKLYLLSLILILLLTGCNQHDTQPFEKAMGELQAYEKSLTVQISSLPELSKELAILEEEQDALLKAKGKAGEEAIKSLLASQDMTPQQKPDLRVYDAQAMSPEEQAQINELVYEIKLLETKIPLIDVTQKKIASTKAGIEKLKALPPK